MACFLPIGVIYWLLAPKLRDFQLLNEEVLEEVIMIYQNERVNNENREQYLKYSKILDELKETDYFNNEQYGGKINTPRKYYTMNEI